MRKWWYSPSNQMGKLQSGRWCKYLKYQEREGAGEEGKEGEGRDEKGVGGGASILNTRRGSE